MPCLTYNVGIVTAAHILQFAAVIRLVGDCTEQEYFEAVQNVDGLLMVDPENNLPPSLFSSIADAVEASLSENGMKFDDAGNIALVLLSMVPTDSETRAKIETLMQAAKTVNVH